MPEGKPLSPEQHRAFWNQVEAERCPRCLGFSFCYCGGAREESKSPNYVRDRLKGAQGDA